jgi:hypothetical protein
MSILLGVNAYPATGEAADRQARALESCLALEGVHLVNLGWDGDLLEVDGFDNFPMLREDSRTASGRPGPRKPIVSAVFDSLALLAGAAGRRWFAYANSDIAWTQAAVDAVVRGGRQVYAFSRGDVDPATGEGVEMVTAGVDAFVVEVAWWNANRRRFRAYIGGEPIWDNVYTAILLAHSDGVLLNREPLVRHERHPAGDWRGSPFAHYLAHLAALDSLYFSRWADYHQRLEAMRARGATAEEEMALQDAAFRGPFPAGARLWQAGRALKARARWALQRRREA